MKDAKRKPVKRHVHWEKKVIEAKSSCYSKNQIKAIERLSDLTCGHSDCYFVREFRIDETVIPDPVEKIYVKMALDAFYGGLGQLAISLSEEISDPFEAIAILENVDMIVKNTRFLAQCEDEIFKLEFKHRQMSVANARKMREHLAKKLGPKIQRRHSILEAAGYNLDDLSKSRKSAEAITADFAAKCEAQGIDRVSGKQIQRDARDILKARHENSGRS